MTILSHYTSRSGLEGIASTKTLWASNFLDLKDSSEFTYAWHELQKGALKLFFDNMPPGLMPPEADPLKIAKQSTEQFKDYLKNSTGGLLYVVSFARCLNDDHRQRGHLTMWDRYTRHEGYCMQFDEKAIRRLIRLESLKGSYAVLFLDSVEYGVNTNDQKYRELCYQLAQQWLVQAMRARPEIRFEPDFGKIWPDSRLHYELARFCALHKDPCYEDEREMRIFAYPSVDARIVPLMGIANVKKEHQKPDGSRYIILGEYWTPELAPDRLIVGTKADPNINSVLSHYSQKPEIAFANLPVA